MKTKEQRQEILDKTKKANVANREKRAEYNKLRESRGEDGKWTSSEANEVKKLDREWAKNEGIIIGQHVAIAHLEASAKAISVVTGDEVSRVEGYLDDEDNDGPFRDGLKLARTGRAAEMATAYYGGKLAGWAGGKLLDAIIGKALGKAAPNLVRVTSWADEGITPDLNPGRWVQLGEATPTNFLKTGLPGPKGFLQTTPPWLKFEGSKVPFSNSITGEVPGSSLQWPAGGDKWRGIFGQRQISSE